MSNRQTDNGQGHSSRQSEESNSHEVIGQVGLGDEREEEEEEEAAITSYMAEGYTPLNFNTNVFAMADGSDDENDDLNRERDEEDRDDELFSEGYYHLGALNRRVNGVKSHAGEFASSFREETDGHMANQIHHSDSDEEDLVPHDFHSLADRVLRGLEEDHQVTLQRSDQQTSVVSTLIAPSSHISFSDDEHRSNILAECSLDNEQNSDSPEFVANFQTTDISFNNNSLVEKSSTARRIPPEKMNATGNNNKIEDKTKPVDIDAIKKAMQSIRVKSPQFASALDAASSSSSTSLLAYKAATRVSYNALINSTCNAVQERQCALDQSQQTILSHQIIPTGPLAAFRRNTPKAHAASHNLSRSATLSEALVRLWPLICFRRKLFDINERELPKEKHDEQEHAKSTRLLTIHIIGADGVECSSEDSVRNAVGAFARWLDAALKSGSLSDSLSTSEISHAVRGNKVLIEFSGPNMPEYMVGKEFDLLPQTQSDSPSKGLESATCVFYKREYHESENSTIGSTTADLTVAFNAGVW